jgi:diaminopimelate decarboxylase
MITCGTLVSQPFQADSSGLSCDGISVAAIAEAAGTPLYIYSAKAIRDAYRAIDDAFAGYPHAIHYALKANSTLAIARVLRALGSRADANSGGEIRVAQRAGFEAAHIVFTGVGKTREELRYAIDVGVGAINCESAGEIDRIAEIARGIGKEARVALRVNPDIDARSHPNISTGLKTNKFGVPINDARRIYRERRGLQGVRFTGVHVHIGSQITSVEPLRRAAESLVEVALDLRADGVALEHMDLGGGLGVAYEGRPVVTAREYADAVIPILRRVGLPVILEPGRAIVAHAGALVSRVVDTKVYPEGPSTALGAGPSTAFGASPSTAFGAGPSTPLGAGPSTALGASRKFIVLDAGMTELMRPALYGSFHRIVPVMPRGGAEQPLDVVGPICESSDVFARERLLPPVEVGDLVAVLDVGAYGAAMASNYNRRMLAPEVLVDDGQWRIIRRRQTLEDVLALEM